MAENIEILTTQAACITNNLQITLVQLLPSFSFQDVKGTFKKFYNVQRIFRVVF